MDAQLRRGADINTSNTVAQCVCLPNFGGRQNQRREGGSGIRRSRFDNGIGMVADHRAGVLETLIN